MWSSSGGQDGLCHRHASGFGVRYVRYVRYTPLALGLSAFWRLGPLCFLFFVFPSRPLPLTPPGRVLPDKSIPDAPGRRRRFREISHLRPLFWNRGVFTRAAALRTRRTHEAAQPNLPRCMALNSLRLTSELQDAGKVAISGLAVANGPGSHVDKPLRNTGDCAHASGDQKRVTSGSSPPLARVSYALHGMDADHDVCARLQHGEQQPSAAAFSTCSTWAGAAVIGTASMDAASSALERYILLMLTVRAPLRVGAPRLCMMCVMVGWTSRP